MGNEPDFDYRQGACGAIVTCPRSAGFLGWPSLRSYLEIIRLAQLDRDRLCSQLGALGVFIRADGDVPASSRIGMHLDLKPFFGEAVSDHFRQFLGRPFWFLHGSVPSFNLNPPSHGRLHAAATVILP